MISLPTHLLIHADSVRPIKRRASIFSALLAASLFFVSVGSSFARSGALAQAGSDRMIVTAAAVRMRTGPQVTAREVTRLKLGTVVRVLERSANQETIGQMNDYWYRVSVTDGKTGWVFGGLMTGFDPDRREETYRRIAAERLKLERATFEDHVELVNFLAHALTEVKQSETRAELGLDRLLALKLSLEAIPMEKQEQPPYRAWIKARDAEIDYSEPAGQWLVRAQLFWDLHKKYRSLPVAERIAWEASQIYLPGECEGYLPCHLYLSRVTAGEYLKLYPEGAHASAALKSLAEDFSPIVEDLKGRKTYDFPTEASDRAELKKTLDELREIVMKTSASEREGVLKQIGEIAQASR